MSDFPPQAEMSDMQLAPTKGQALRRERPDRALAADQLKATGRWFAGPTFEPCLAAPPERTAL